MGGAPLRRTAFPGRPTKACATRRPTALVDSLIKTSGMGTLMLVRMLEVVYYPPDGSHWQVLETRDPDWACIEAAICRLERDVWPYIWLHTAEPVEGEMP